MKNYSHPYAYKINTYTYKQINIHIYFIYIKFIINFVVYISINRNVRCRFATPMRVYMCVFGLKYLRALYCFVLYIQIILIKLLYINNKTVRSHFATRWLFFFIWLTILKRGIEHFINIIFNTKKTSHGALFSGNNTVYIFSFICFILCF